MGWLNVGDVLHAGGPWGEGPTGGDKGRGKNSDPVSSPQEEIEMMLARAKSRLSGGGGSGGSGGLKLAPFILVAAAFWLAKDMFYTVDEGYRAIILRWGKAVVDSEGNPKLYDPGPHLRLPSLIDRVVMVKTDAIRKEEIGFETYGAYSRMGVSSREKGRPTESLMLTRDENIIDVKLVVQWKVKDPVKFSFNFRDRPGESTVKAAATAAIREALGNIGYTEALQGEGRRKIEVDVETTLQGILDSYQTGVLITSVDLKHIDPPEQVIDAFRDVQTARANKETVINQAQAYANDVVPRAKGAAGRIVQEAEAYKSEKIDQALGEAGRFTSILNEYQKAKGVTRERLYAETMEQVLGNSEVTLVDLPEKSGVLPYLPLGALSEHSGKKKTAK